MITDLAYGGVALSAKAATQDRGATLRIAETPFPLCTAQQVVDAIAGALNARTKLVVVDHVTARSGSRSQTPRKVSPSVWRISRQ